jgi:hypothetical protein
MTPADIIAEARRLLQDTRVPFRYTEAELLSYVNQTLRRVLTVRPDLFIDTVTVPLTAGTVLQSLPADAHRLVDVYYVEGYNSVNEVERLILERGYPQWVSDPAGIPYNFVRHARNPTKFFVYPRPVENLNLVVDYVVAPPTYEVDDTITAPTDGYMSAIVDGVVFLASSIDDEHVLSGRAKLFLDSFMQTLGTDLQGRVLTDEEEPTVASGNR